MFERLFAESGLSLDRLRAMLEVGAAGSIVRAANGDPVRQSQYSRQIKELEEFFRVKLIERHGKGMVLTANGRELARISRFFLRGLANFQRGCLAEEHTYRVVASATVIQQFLIPAANQALAGRTESYTFDAATNDEIERGLHDLTADFGVVTRAPLSRPLQTQEIGATKLALFVPKRLYPSRASAVRALKAKRLPLAIAAEGLEAEMVSRLMDLGPRIVCPSFLAARAALQGEAMAAVVPVLPGSQSGAARFWKVAFANAEAMPLRFYLAWNPRLLRLNPFVVRTRDFLARALAAAMGK